MTYKPIAPNAVTIFGAGIAGLTAAHELVERGFQVQVWESEGDSRYPERGSDAGGLARTQWGAIDWPMKRSLDKIATSKPKGSGSAYWESIQAQPISHIPHRYYIAWSPGKFVKADDEKGTPIGLDKFLSLLQQLSKANPIQRIRIAAFGVRDLSPEERQYRAGVVMRQLSHRLPDLLEGEPDSDGAGLSFEIKLKDGHKIEVAVVDSGNPDKVEIEVESGPDIENITQTDYYLRKWSPETDSLVGIEPSLLIVDAIDDAFSRIDDADLSIEISAARLFGLDAAQRQQELAHLYPANLVEDAGGFSVTRGDRSIKIAIVDNAASNALDLIVNGNPGGGSVVERRRYAGTWPSGDSLATVFVTTSLTDSIADALSCVAAARHVRHIYIEVAARRLTALGDEELDVRAGALAQLFNEHTKKRSPLAQVTKDGERYKLQLPGRGPIELIPVLVPELPFPAYDRPVQGFEAVLSFRPREQWLPGEHGYRFFPSFYHHVFDTMKRTPLLETIEKPAYFQAQERAAGMHWPEKTQYVESGRTVFDNVRPTSSHLLALSGQQRPSQLSRFAIGSLEELREYLSVLFGEADEGGLGLDPRDATRITLKVLQFATSCEERRRQYEGMSWLGYLGGKKSYQPNTVELLEKWPRALVAMQASECDARTEGVPLMQLLLDQTKPEAYRDGTLVGPTSEAWIKPWRTYLEAQGVEFIHGALQGFYEAEVIDPDAKTTHRQVLPRVDCYDERYACSPGLIRPGYFVVAVDALEAKRLGETTMAISKKPGEGGGSLLEELVGSEDWQRVAKIDEEDFAQFSGIQFYFAEDVLWADGHVYYPDTPWGLTSISQARFWQDRMDWEHGYRGVLSVIIGDWTTPDDYGDAAEDCTPQMLAERVWEQIKTRVEGRKRRPGSTVGRFVRRTPDGPIPYPIAWHLDQTVVAVSDAANPKKRLSSTSKMFMAKPGKFGQRAGSLEGYAVTCGVVLAGHHTQTFTRLPCMESANESARHAVNAIIRDIREKELGSLSRPASFCDVWNPEDREIDDLQFLRDIDRKLFDRNVPHLFEVVDADFLAQHVLRGDSEDPLDPLKLLGKLRRIFREAH